MSNKTNAPYGTWQSPLSVEDLTSHDNVAAFVDLLVDSKTSSVYHIEKRPAERGRNTLVETATGKDLTSGDWDVRSSVNGYGGAPAIVHDGVVYFSHAPDGRVYKVASSLECVPEPITPENPNYRFANFDVWPLDPALLICAMEDSTGTKSPLEVVNKLCVLNSRTKVIFPLESDASFYAAPVFSPDGKHLAWIEWDLPDMPWHGSELWIADVVPTDDSESLSFQNPRLVAGEHGKISVAYPSWLSAEVLLFTSDESGYENPWMFDCAASESQARSVLAEPIAESFGYGQPPRLGYSPYAIADPPTVVFTAVRDGRSVFYVVSTSNGSAEPISCPFAEVHAVRALRPNQFVFIGTKVDQGPALIECTLSPEPFFENLQPSSSSSATLAAEYISLPQPMSLHGKDPDEPVHVVYYPPTNPQYTTPEDERPPCILNVHGGPVGFSPQSYSSIKQFFTTRGWAWLDVNFGGSSGYGRAYRSRLFKNWGILDVDDCVLATRTLSAAPHSLIDPKRTVIRGASGGGFAVFAALSFRAAATDGLFAAGTSLYGISDLRLLLKDTHKYESRYLSLLVGDEDDAGLFESRSAVHHADKITVPLLVLQGEADKAVPKAQADVIVESIRKRGGVVEYKLYEGEGHGWKRKDTIEDSILREWRFYNRVLGIQAESLP
ncbi:Peptidase-S9 domain-containing protein [Mycena chlorophos]|uniref:Peptidase-S9 domain-containing protein n=1 Tax=Mycena chlorophos TaxID=658473 RepID=A0A8H6S6X0_MYCCL|nr:Peptidase-S9 domain-containing protein [Mycena chlorophos]